MQELDKTDVTILQLLQKDSSISITDLAERVNLTTTPCWKRVHRLEDLGVIEKRVALLNADKVKLGFIAFVQIKTSNHSNEWYNNFVDIVNDYPEVMEFYRMAGEYDYMMRIQVKNMKAFDTFYKKLVCEVKELVDVTSTFSMEQLKYTHELPIS